MTVSSDVPDLAADRPGVSVPGVPDRFHGIDTSSGWLSRILKRVDMEMRDNSIQQTSINKRLAAIELEIDHLSVLISITHPSH